MRAQKRNEQRERQEREAAHSIEDSARPSRHSRSRHSPFISPPRGQSREGYSPQDAEVPAFNLRQKGEKGPLENFRVEAGGRRAASRYRTPSPMDRDSDSDGSSICLTPAPVKGLARASSPRSEPDDEQWLETLDAPAAEAINGRGMNVVAGV